MSFYRRWFFALGMVSACGGRVVVDTNAGVGGTGGAGGDGAFALSTCAQWCESRAPQCASTRCMDACVEYAGYLVPCASEYEALLQCRAAHPPPGPPDCYEATVACNAQYDALDACAYPAGPCEEHGPAGVEVGDHNLNIEFVCGSVVYTSGCGHKGSYSFPMDCVCLIDGETAGTCQAITIDGVSLLGCCSATFAESQ